MLSEYKSPHEDNRLPLPEVWEEARARLLLDLADAEPVPEIKLNWHTRTRWTREEDRVLFAHYGSKTASQLTDVLPGRTRHMIIGRARRLQLQDPTRSPIPQRRASWAG